MRVIISILLCVLTLPVFGQRVSAPIGNATSMTHAAGLLTSDVQLRVPGEKVLLPYFDSTGSLAVYGGLLWYHSGNQWIACGTGGVIDTGIYSTVYMLNSGLALKQNLLTLVTSGSSGPASISGDTLYIPDYSSGSSFDSTHIYKALADSTDTLRGLIGLKQNIISAGTWLVSSGDTIGFDSTNHIDTDFNSPSNNKVPTSAAVNGAIAQVQSDIADSLDWVRDSLGAVRGDIPDVSIYATTNAVSDSVSGRQTYHDTTIFDATMSWVYGLGYSTNAGTVTTVSVVSANGFAAIVSNATTTPAITMSTTVNGMVKGDGTALSAAVPETDFVAPTGFGTVIDKMLHPHDTTVTSATTSVTIDIDRFAEYRITAQAGALLFNAPSGTAHTSQWLTVSVGDDGTARALTFNSEFEESDVTLPTTTEVGKEILMVFHRNSANLKWVIVGKVSYTQ